MPKLLSIISFLFLSIQLFAQDDTTKRALLDTNKIVLDSASVVKDLSKVDNVKKKETKEERKIREKAEKERSIYYYKDILKDSSRLEIERLSRIAWKRSALLPGWGQITNGGKYLWIKLPVIYGGFITAYVIFDYWNWHYQKFVKEAAYRIDNGGATLDPDLVGFKSLDGLIRSKDNYRRYRDMTILITAVWWAGNVVEAYTDSMLRFRYNIGDDLGLKITPTLLPASSLAMNTSFNKQFTPGVKLTFNIK